jgi:hypothetical protein
MTNEQQISLERLLSNVEFELDLARNCAVNYDRDHWLMKAVASLREAKKLLEKLERAAK